MFKRYLDKPDGETKLRASRVSPSPTGAARDGVAGIPLPAAGWSSFHTGGTSRASSARRRRSAERVAQCEDALRALEGVVSRRAEERERIRGPGSSSSPLGAEERRSSRGI